MTAIELLTLKDEDIARMIIQAQDVACVHPSNAAEHALLVLIKSGYSAIPVVDSDNKVVGIISKTLILDRILGLERIEFETLSTFTVKDVMNVDVHRIREDDSLMRALQMSIDAPFICVENQIGEFSGLLTRHGVLAFLYNVMRQGAKKS